MGGERARIWKNSSLSIVLSAITLLLILAMFLTGWQVYDWELTGHRRTAVGALTYLTSGHFLSTMFENWESELLKKGCLCRVHRFARSEWLGRLQRSR